ncbi:MAG: hypothetical protein J6X85_01455, partial [Ruminococcus sp.]|nr:hypothetical protein [Ruminococcus sp.]
SVLEDLNTLKIHMGKVRDALEGFRYMGITKLVEADECLNKTEEALKQGGVPVFKIPEAVQPDIPERPMSLSEKIHDDEDKRKKQEELDKLKHMAESIGSKKDDKNDKGDKSPSDDAAEQKADNQQNGEKKSGKLDLAALAAKANSLKNK